MISWSQFLSLVTNSNILNRRIDRDQPQQDAVRAPGNTSLFIIAGPGSGKTTVLTLRVLKLIFVDDVDPATILATTFTRKAAAELRSRILGWGDQLRQELLITSISSTLRSQLERLDLNRVITGTIDSIAEQTLADFRAPGTQPPIPLEEFVADAMMQRSGLWSGRRDQNPDFQNYVQVLRGETRNPNLKDMLDICSDVRDRFAHDQIDVVAYETSEATGNPGATILLRVIDDYISRLNADLVMDFAALEQEFLDRLNAGSLDRFLQGLQIVLVDEYQDTNLLQEQIYFALARDVCAGGGSITVVGDDDQSLYRFRGATVELFTEFRQRLSSQCSIQAMPIYLSNNYRSTQTIVTWYSNFIQLDPAFTPVRVPNKPALSASRSGSFIEYPILGMFRPDVATLARDLAGFIDGVFNRNGVTVSAGTQQFRIARNPTGGAIGDCALLCSSPREYSAGGNQRLPLLIRNELAGLQNPIEVFNPRGQEFSEIMEVEQLCGLMLECIDPSARVQNSVPNFPGNIHQILNRWRQISQQYIVSNPLVPGSARSSTNTLQNFVRAWQSRTPQGSGGWPREVSLIQLLYELITWIPPFQEDAEGLVYLEVITRTITQSARFISYDATIQRDQPQADESVKAILWGIFEPLASGAIDIDEDLIELLPRDRLNILSIHQAKGLEFPLIIVDVGSDFKGDYWRTQGFKRFPLHDNQDGIRARAPRLEDVLRRFSPLGIPTRPARDREFDDLVRQYFVAFSRPQDVLVLVGLSDRGSVPRAIPNVATGWIRDGQWLWSGLPGIIYL